MGQVGLKLLTDEQGQSMAEYGLLTALVAVASVLAVRALGGAVTAKFSKLASEIAK